MDYVFTNSVPYLMNRTGNAIGLAFAERLREHGITLPMYRVLAVLRQTGSKNLGELSAMVSKELSTLSRIVGQMEGKGLLTRVRPKNNGRLVDIDLTRDGEGLADALMPIAVHFETVLTEALTPQEVESLKDMLRRVDAQIDKL